MKVSKANCGASTKPHKGFNMGGGYQKISNTSRLSKNQDREQKLKSMGLSTGAMVERKETAESMKKGAQKGSTAKPIQSQKKKSEVEAYGGSYMTKKKSIKANKGLYANINAKKKAGTSNSKANSTISDEAYANMKAGFPKKKKK